MTTVFWLVLLAAAAVVGLRQLQIALGLARGTLAGLGGLLVLGGGWYLLTWSGARTPAAGQEMPHLSVTSTTCAKCHPDHYASWYRTYHRSMTREATPENVKGDFQNATYTVQGITTRLTREGNNFYMETLDPKAADGQARGPMRKFQVARLVGSHWFQECMYRDDAGRYWRLPVSYHIVEHRWIHTNGAFLAPDTDDFWNKSTVWNESCVFCHNTKPSKMPLRPGWGRGGLEAGYQTEVAELGIACEACHGPGGYHVRVNQNPGRRFALGDDGDPTIVNPRRLTMQRTNDICAHCHGALTPRFAAWDPRTLADPYDAGEELTRSHFFFWSELEQKHLYGHQQRPAITPQPAALDGRFWGDGTPLTTALEYQGMALSACYENGHGRLTCLSCHQLHPCEPNFLLADGMKTNEACYQCHELYRERLTAHTHHPADSAGSLCYNCHMPYQVYSLLTTHRSHRIEGLRVKDSLGTGKPHACNLCHLDKSLGWTQENLAKWYGRAPKPLSEPERTYGSALLLLCQGDARTRAVVAGAFSWPAAQEASGTDWAGLFLPRLLAHERYPAVRYLAHRGLRSMYGADADGYEYLADSADRAAQLAVLRSRLADRCRPAAAKYPGLPLDAAGQPTAILDDWLRKRNDPDVTIHE
jgi:predicted CXXCH cytochrome family protein